MKLGIVGHGFVGSAVSHGFTKELDKFIVDPKYFSENTISDLVKFNPDATFVAVPTPQLESGECNTEILESVLKDLNQIKNHLVIIKSTVPAYKLQAFQEQCIDLRIVYNPEFLTERTAYDDLCNSKFHVIGIDDSETEAKKLLLDYHNSMWPDSKSIFVTNKLIQ